MPITAQQLIDARSPARTLVASDYCIPAAAIRFDNTAGWRAVSTKAAGAQIDYSVDWRDWLAKAGGDEVLTAPAVSASGCTLQQQAHAGGYSIGLVSGGTVGQPASITFTAVTATRTEERTIHLEIVAP